MNQTYFKYRNIPSWDEKEIHDKQKDYFDDILSNNKLFCSCYQDLNDPSEWYFESKSSLIQDILSKDKDLSRICCLSSTCINTLMWCMYANDHKGCCLEVEVCDKDIYKSIEVNYNDEKASLKNNDYVNLINVLAHKTPDWKHEKETRFIKNRSREEEFTYLDICIKSVILGCRVQGNDLKKVVELIRNKKPNIPIYQIKREVFTQETSLDRMNSFFTDRTKFLDELTF